MKSYPIIIVLIMLIISGCGNEVSTSTKDGSATITMAYLDGTWSRECELTSTSTTSAKVAINFFASSDNATKSTTYYTGTICYNTNYVLREKINNITIGSKTTTSGNLIITKYTAVTLDITIEPKSTALATSLNDASFCGLTSWSSGSETSIAGKTCSSTTYSSVNDGFRDLVQMNSERTYIRTGNTSELGSDGYPSTVYYNKYFK